MWLLNLFLYKEQTGLIDFPQQLGYFQILCLLKYSYLPRGGKSNGELKKRHDMMLLRERTHKHLHNNPPPHTNTYTHIPRDQTSTQKHHVKHSLSFFFHQLSVSSLMNYSSQVQEVAHPNPTFPLILALNIFYYWLNHKQSKMYSI